MKEKVFATNNEAVSLRRTGGGSGGAKKSLTFFFNCETEKEGERGIYAGRFLTSLPL